MRALWIGLLTVATAAGVLAAPCQAQGSGPKPSFEVVGDDVLAPEFDWRTKTYAARCSDDELGLRTSARGDWLVSIDGGKFSHGEVSRRLRLRAGQGASVSFRRERADATGKDKRFYVRCLPDDFPAYSFRRLRSGGPEYLFIQMANQYAAIFDADGVPVWWFKADGFPDDAKLLPDGTISWSTVDAVSWQTGPFDVYSLQGRRLRTVGADDMVDVHDLQLLENGNYLIGHRETESGVDTSAYGGSADSSVIGIDIQEWTPDGELVSNWHSLDHIGIEETPARWWSGLSAEGGYDLEHWNAVAVDGDFMYLSFRHLDALYKVDRRSGEIVWKLGGTETPESLEIRGDPDGDQAFGGQHDVRVQPNGSITVFNDRTDLEPAIPSAQRFKIDEENGTATLVQAVTDKKVPTSACCGSARRLPSKDWLVGWGGYTGFVGGYRDDGKVEFRLRTPGAFTYRANEVEDGALQPPQMRRAMDYMSR